MATHHCPALGSPAGLRPARSRLPSPLKSARITSAQWIGGAHWPNLTVFELFVATLAEPLEKVTHHCPDSSHRPTMSALPSPLVSSIRTSTQVTLGLQFAHGRVVND